MASLMAPSTILAPTRTSRAVKINTEIKARKGNQRCGKLVLRPINSAVNADSLTAAAIPIIKDKKENMPTTNPFLTPLYIAQMPKISAMISINIGYFFANNSFTAAEMALPSALPEIV